MHTFRKVVVDLYMMTGYNIPVLTGVNHVTTNSRDVSGRGLREKTQGARLLRGSLPTLSARGSDQPRREGKGSHSSTGMYGRTVSWRGCGEGLVQNALRSISSPWAHHVSGPEETGEDMHILRVQQRRICQGHVPSALASGTQDAGEVWSYGSAVGRNDSSAEWCLRDLQHLPTEAELALWEAGHVARGPRSRNRKGPRVVVRQVQSRNRVVERRSGITTFGRRLLTTTQATRVGGCLMGRFSLKQRTLHASSR